MTPRLEKGKIISEFAGKCIRIINMLTCKDWPCVSGVLDDNDYYGDNYYNE